MALMPWDYDPSARSYGVPQQNQVDRGYGLVYDTTGWEVDPTSGYDRSTYRKKATPEDLRRLLTLANSFIDPNQGGEGNPDPWLTLYDMTGIEYDPNTGYIYSSKGPTPGTGGGWFQSAAPIAAMFGAAYGAGTLGSALGAGEVGAGAAGAGTAGEIGAGSAAAGSAAAGSAGGATSAGLGLDASLATAAGGDATLAGTSGAGALGSGAGTGSSGWLSSLNSALGTNVTGGDILKTGIAALPVIAGATASTGGTPVTSNSTTTNLPSYMQAGAQQTWDDYINNFYGLQGGKSYKNMLDEDTTYKKQAADDLSAFLSKYINQAENRTGLMTPTNISFGGQKVFDFVPKSNRNLVNQLVQLAVANTDLKQNNTPNQAAMAYLDKLFSNITSLSPQGNTSTTQTATTPTTSTWANIIQGLTQGTNLYNAMNSGSAGNQKVVQNADGTYSIVKS